MKKPYLTREERQLIIDNNTLTGSCLHFRLALLLFTRDFVITFKLKKLFYKSPKISKGNYDEKSQILTLVYSDGTTKKFKGDSTVWYSLPKIERCSTFKEAELCDIWCNIMHYGEYKNY